MEGLCSGLGRGGASKELCGCRNASSLVLGRGREGGVGRGSCEYGK